MGEIIGFAPILNRHFLKVFYMNKLVGLLIVSVVFLSACRQQARETIAINDSSTAAKITAPANRAEKHEPAPLVINYNFMPLEIVDDTTEDPFKRYGIEFSGNCYACDLASIHINGSSMKLVNVCDSTDVYRFEKLAAELTNEKFILTSGELTFTFIKKDKAPVYELKINGPKPALKNKRFSRFYTEAAKLGQFTNHDCGDFGG